VELSISWSALFGGMATGFLIAFLFTLVPLLRIRNVSPLQVLRLGEPGDIRTGNLQYVLYSMIVLVLFGLSYLQIREFLQALYFTLFLVFSFLILGAISLLMMKLLRKIFPHSWSYVIRQGLANLYRPNNQTVTLLITIGLGTALLATLFLTQRVLLDRVAYSGQEDRPNMVIFDIQNEQKEEVLDFVRDLELPVLQNVPVVTMRLQSVNGKSRQEIKEDTTSKIRDWALDREYRVTYRDTLIDSETLIAGEFTRPVTSRQDSVFISLEEDYAGDLGLKIGDQLTFNVQGIPVTAYLGSTRQIDWRRVQTNFLVVFPSGVLEKAPQFHVLVTRVESDSVSAAVQRQLVNRFPNVSVIDLKLILTTLEQVLEKAAFVIRFMAVFSMVTGLIVLIVSLIVSRYNRIIESALLRTLGAQKRQIVYINAVEYATLGALASSSGILLSLLASFLLAVYNFEGQFFPSLGPVLLTVVVVTLACEMLGVFNIRGIIKQTPLEILRKEV
jgi:putative ABC transport system permease protein